MPAPSPWAKNSSSWVRGRCAPPLRRQPRSMSSPNSRFANPARPRSTRRCASWLPRSTPRTRTISDGTDHINPASLRGLGPDQVLVLINGKRRHSSALVHVNGTFGRGTVGVDLNAIPKAAVERIEILRDGARGPVRLGRHRRRDQHRPQGQHPRNPAQQLGRHYGRRRRRAGQDGCELRLRAGATAATSTSPANS